MKRFEVEPNDDGVEKFTEAMFDIPREIGAVVLVMTAAEAAERERAERELVDDLRQLVKNDYQTAVVYGLDDDLEHFVETHPEVAK